MGKNEVLHTKTLRLIVNGHLLAKLKVKVREPGLMANELGLQALDHRLGCPLKSFPGFQVNLLGICRVSGSRRSLAEGEGKGGRRSRPNILLLLGVR